MALSLLASLTLVHLLAQNAPGPVFPTGPIEREPAPETVGGIALKAGKQALAEGRAAEAIPHLRTVLVHAPWSPTALRGLLAAVGEDADARAFWGARLWLTSCNEKGRFTPDPALKPLLPAGPLSPADLALARALAVEELAAFAARSKPGGNDSVGNGLLTRWAADLAMDIAWPAPALRQHFAPLLDAALDAHAPDAALVVAALRRLLDGASAPSVAGDDAAAAQRRNQEVAIRAARCLAGLAAQAGFKDLEGPKPTVPANLLAAGREARARIRQKIEGRVGAPLTVEELEALDEPARVRFTREHATWANPGLARSRTGRYVIQTTCGFETLLAAASTVELHHARLCSWYGKDPFTERPGLIRIVPEHDDLEAEDAPFWWAGGFQSGDLTVLRSAWSNVEGLGRGLTHELTHRFDGVLIPFLPAWLVEGRAVWTAGAYGSRHDPKLAERFLSPWGVQTAFIRGYGDPGRLTELLEGTVKDYRDNYTAGYALFVFLSTWPTREKPLYAEPLARYLRTARAGSKRPTEYFVEHFADGHGGRPKGLEAFAPQFRQFLEGCYKKCWNEPVPWTDQYVMGLPGAKDNPQLDDEASWSWGRDRAEPWFGQGHAADAGELLASLNQPREAAAALLWSLRVDGPDPGRALLLAEQLRKLERHGAAWVVRQDLAAPTPAPMLDQLPRLREFLRLLAASARLHHEQGLEGTAQARAEEHDRLTARLGLDARALPESGTIASPHVPRAALPQRLGLLGFFDDRLTHYEERRAPGLWYESAEGDLHVGRSKPKAGTGELDRAAAQRDVFVRTQQWQPAGRYVVRARIHMTTTFVSGSLVLGHTRRDRSLRLHFSAGDFLYAIGRKSDQTKMDRMSFSMDGGWEREHRFPQARAAHEVKFPNPTPFVDLEVWIDGPRAEVRANGQRLFSYASADGAPIAGHLGFAMGQGAIRVQDATVERLDCENLEAPPRRIEDLARLDGLALEQALHRRFAGLPPAPHGTLLLRVPDGQKFDRTFEQVRAVLAGLAAGPAEGRQTLMLSLPGTASEESRTPGFWHDATGASIAAVRQHGSDGAFAGKAWLLFFDQRGVLRAGAQMRGGEQLPDAITAWVRRYRRAGA